MRFNNLMWCLFHRPGITITIGRPFQPAFDAGGPPKARRRELMDDIMGRIAALLPPEYRGVYGGGENA
jgi:hypothetical protein